jgi:twinkle protein
MNEQEGRFYDLEEIKNALASKIDEFVLTLYPNAKRESQGYRIGSINGEKGDSMLISTRPNNAGYFLDFATGEKGKAWRLVSLNKSLSFKEGLQWLANFLNVKPIQSFGSVSKSKDPEKLAKDIRDLSPACIEYAKNRGISEETLRKYGVGTDAQGKISFPYYDAYGRLGMIKHWGLTLKPDGKKDTWTSSDPIMSLFGKDVCDPDTGIQKLVITEGEWDAMACWEMNIPAVSIPMGCSNTQWITEDYQFLSHFDEIVLLFDNDLAGKKAAKDAAARLGQERCLIVTLPLKDANDMLRANRGKEIGSIIENTTPEPIAEIVNPTSMKEGVKSYLKGDYLSDGDAFFIPDFKLSFRPHETTLWFGGTGEGKSTAVANQVASLAARGKMCCVASLEQPPEITFGQILKMLASYPNLPYTDEFEKAYEYLSKHVFMYKSMERADPKDLISTFVHAHKRYGVDTMVVDNMMTLAIDRSNNTAQAEACDLFRVFVSKYPVHLHLVAHPRKPPTDPNGKQAPPAQLSEIRGASEIADMANNIITVWRDRSKAELMEEKEEAGFSPSEINQFFESTPCGKMIVRKQRATGKWPQTSYWFDELTGRITPKCGSPSPMFSEKPW